MSVTFSIKANYTKNSPYDFDMEYTCDVVHLDEAVFHMESVLKAAGFVFNRLEAIKDREEELPQLNFDFEIIGDKYDNKK